MLQAISATGEVSFSSSAIDTVELLHYLVVFWKHLEWSNPEETYGFTVIVVKVRFICRSRKSFEKIELIKCKSELVKMGLSIRPT